MSADRAGDAGPRAGSDVSAAVTPSHGGPYGGPEAGTTDRTGLDVRLDAGVLTIAFERPSFDVATTLSLAQRLRDIADDPQVRVLVLRGAGSGFGDGLDAVDFADAKRHSAATLRAARNALDEIAGRLLPGLPQPVLAQVHGACRGAACMLVVACDIAYAADDACFDLSDAGADPAADFAPAGALGKAAMRVMAPRAVSWHALTGRGFDGREAERNGLVTCSVDRARLAAEVETLARELVAKDALALQFTKQSLRHLGAMSWDGALSYNNARAAELRELQAGRPSSRASGVESFLSGKSKPGLGT